MVDSPTFARSQLISLAHGYVTGEFEVTQDNLGCYLPTEHIDNPKGYADGEDARQYDPRLRGPVDPAELQIDELSGMKNYIANGEYRHTDSYTLLMRVQRRETGIPRQSSSSGGYRSASIWDGSTGKVAKRKTCIKPSSYLEGRFTLCECFVSACERTLTFPGRTSQPTRIGVNLVGWIYLIVTIVESSSSDSAWSSRGLSACREQCQDPYPPREGCVSARDWHFWRSRFYCERTSGRQLLFDLHSTPSWAKQRIICHKHRCQI